jgi:hypothetical protein
VTAPVEEAALVSAQLLLVVKLKVPIKSNP